MTLYFEFSRKEAEQRLPYRLICETVHGNKWDTIKRRRLQTQWFNEEDASRLSEIKRLATTWALKTGIPMDGVRMSYEMYNTWQKFGLFCQQLN